MYKNKIKNKKTANTKHPENLGHQENSKCTNNRNRKIRRNPGQITENIFSKSQKKSFPNLKKVQYIEHLVNWTRK